MIVMRFLIDNDGNSNDDIIIMRSLIDYDNRNADDMIIVNLGWWDYNSW